MVSALRLPASRLRPAPGSLQRPARPPAEMRRRILSVARDQYTRLGFSAVTMDETAAAAGVSKKTLYRHFSSKEDLLVAVTHDHVEKVHADLCAIYRDTGRTPLQRLRGMMDYLAGMYSELSVSLVHDMRRCAPECWREVETNRKRNIEGDFSTLLREGRAKGYFRKEIDPRIFLLIYAEVAKHVLNPEVFTRLGIAPDRLFSAVCKVLFEGILTDAARKEYHDAP